MAYARKVDNNHSTIIKELRQAGYKVLDLSRLGHGCPDVLVCAYGWQVLVEIKDAKGKLTPDERAFFEGWDETLVMVAHNSEDVFKWFEGIMRLSHD